MTRLVAWWRARTAREKILLQVCAALLFAVLLPVWAYHAAASYRASSTAALAGARTIQADVTRLARATAGAQSADSSLRGLATASAETAGLAIVRAESTQQDRLSIAFSPASSLKVYRWLDLMARRGVVIDRTLIVRVENGEDVEAQFELAAGL